MSAELDSLAAAVTKIKGAKASAISLIQGTAQYIRDHVDDPAALTAFAAELDADAVELGAAVAANPLPGA